MPNGGMQYVFESRLSCDKIRKFNCTNRVCQPAALLPLPRYQEFLFLRQKEATTFAKSRLYFHMRIVGVQCYLLEDCSLSFQLGFLAVV